MAHFPRVKSFPFLAPERTHDFRSTYTLKVKVAHTDMLALA